jgi:hypothetical protein
MAFSITNWEAQRLNSEIIAVDLENEKNRRRCLGKLFEEHDAFGKRAWPPFYLSISEN